MWVWVVYGRWERKIWVWEVIYGNLDVRVNSRYIGGGFGLGV